MSRFVYQAGILTPAPAQACLDAAVTALTARGGHPVPDGWRVSSPLGYWLRTRFVGGAFAPTNWSPTDVSVAISEVNGQRQVVVSVAERFGAGALLGMETRLRNHCQQTAMNLRATLAQLLGGVPLQ
jgi:hypothetical protein